MAPPTRAMRIHADGVLFDNDGVLVDSEAHVDDAWTRLADEFDLDVSTLAAERSGVRAVDTLRRHLDGDTLTAAIDRLEEIEVSLAADVRALPGSVELCATLPAGSWTIATSASRRLAETRWTAAGVPIPAATITADDVSCGKPDPEPYLAAAGRLGLDPSRCVVFEDSPSGGESARRAGATVVAVGDVPWTTDPRARVRDLTAVNVVESSTHRLALEIEI